MSNLGPLEEKSIFVIHEAARQFKKIGVLWSVGKDSTTTVWLCRKAFFGQMPFPVIHIDTGYKFPQMYAFRDRLVKEWGLKLLVAENKKARSEGMGLEKGKFECCTALKTEALKILLEKEGFDALILAIRRDEHGIRAKERYFSPRDKDFHWDYKNQAPEMWDMYANLSDDKTHTRIHPILHWTELNVWEYIKQEGIPINPMYLAKDGKRYRSLGCMPCTGTIESNADTIDKIVEELKTTKISERSGRAQDKEKAFMMQKLRMLGYM